MTPVPQQHEPGQFLISQEGASLAPGDVVITGMSGMFPKSNNVMEWSENLYNKVDMIDEQTRWNYSHPEAPKSVGVCPDLHTFDAQFFKVHYKQAVTMDVMSRKLLEQAYQAIYDSGTASEELSNKKVGVFIGTCISEMEKIMFYKSIQNNPFGIAGCSRSMFANRISYWLNTRGPSFSIDANCSSSMVALERAYESIRRGDCEAAIVGGASFCFHPHVSVHYHRLGMLCDDGKTRSFDKNASGCVRADSVNCLFLQRAENAKRIYAQVHSIKLEYNIDNEAVGEALPYGPARPVKCLTDFWEDFYRDANVSPIDVDYVEAYGSAVPAADRSELEAIGQIFCKDRKQPLPVGSVMSNMGNGDAASGVNAVMKVLLAYHTGKIASNLHFETPRDDVPALHDGRIEVVNDHRPIDRSAFAAVNSFSLGGVNVHALLRGYYKKKNLDEFKTGLPRLVAISTRTDSGVKNILDYLKSQPIDAEQIRLLHNIHEHDVQGHLGRGYAVLSTNDEGQTVSLAENCDYYSGLKRPVWFVYSGMGSQWAGMGAQLMRIPIFAAAIHKCCKVLEPKGVDLMRVLIDPDKTIYDNILNSFVGIAAVQIGLTDILRELGIVPDNIIGHSVGELGCAYADGCFSAEEMILAAYSRGLVSVQTPFIRGAMAAVGLGYKDILDMCPPEIEVACHNGPESSTISGPADAMRTFVQELTAKGIFAKEVPCSNIAYHSRYIAEAGPALLKYLSEVIKDPKPRSEKWVSTSVPQDKWDQEAAKYSSAEYHTNNLLRSVLFEETSRLIPSNAVVIEIAPHGLLQAILKRSLHADCVHVPLTRRGHSDAVTFFLDNIGKLYQNGLTPQLHVLYPKVEFPVSTGTPMLSHLVEWMHSERWPLPKYTKENLVIAGTRHHLVSIHDQEHKYIEDNIRNGVMIFPEAAMLVLVWETFRMLQGQSMNKIPVAFRKVRFDSEITVHPDETLDLKISIQKGSGRFEICHEGSCAVSGHVAFTEKLINLKDAVEWDKNDYLNSSDIYKLFHLKGYSYSGLFRSIQKTNVDFTKGQIIWNNNWVTFIDSLLQLNTLRRNHDGISKVKYIRSLRIDQERHKKITEINNTQVDAAISAFGQITKCGSVILEGVSFSDVPAHRGHFVIKKREFVPYHPVGKFDVSSAIHVFLQIVAENATRDQINIVEAIEDNQEALGDQIVAISNELINVNANYRNVQTKDIFVEPNIVKESDIIISKHAISNSKIIQYLSQNINKNSFILSIETDRSIKQTHFVEVAAIYTPIGRLVLLKLRMSRESNEHVSLVSAPQEVSNFSFLEHTRNNLMLTQRLIVISDVPPPRGLVDLIDKWRKEPEKNKIHLIITDNKTDTDCNFSEQMDKNLAVNMYKKGAWGKDFYLPNNLQLETVSPHVKLLNVLPGDLGSFTWLEEPQHRINKNTVQVHYAGPSYYDVMKATGKIPSITEKDFYGMDFSGVTQSGERVMGVVASGALASTVEPDPQFLWPVPDHWSLEDAATVPMPYMHAFYCLLIKGKIRRGLRVLIHSGAGALGQAAISIALAMDCEVFTTVSDSRKKTFLKKLFPSLQDDYIGCSRGCSFEDMIMSATNGQGCHVIINCLVGEFREATMRCTGAFSVFVDVALSDILEDRSFRMNNLALNRTYSYTNFSLLFEMRDTETKKNMLVEGISAGYVRPLTRVTLSAAEVQRAFRLMAGSRHRGRVLLNMADRTSLPLQPRMSFSSTGSYVVVCGDHELGLELADLLVKRGAKNLAIHADQLNDGYSKLKSKSWKSQQINVQFSASNLHTSNNAVNYLKESAKLGSIQGIFVVDATEEFTSIEDSVVGNLDKAARRICPALKQFVILRPVADNMESIAEIVCADRNSQNLPGLYLNLPTLNKKFDQKLEISHTISSALDALEICLKLDYQVAATYTLKKLQTYDLVEKIGRVLGRNIADLPNDTTLEDLGVDFESSEEIRNILERRYKFSYSRQNVPQLTLGKLKETQLKLMSTLHREPKGLSVYFANIHPDEMNATAELTVMQTLSYNQAETGDYFESKETYLILVPGMEGHHAIFETLCSRLKVFSLVLQPGLDNPNETIKQTAERFVKLILKMIEVDGKFYLLGYSFGALIALEMAALLEKEGLEGTVFCMDSAPDVFRSQLFATLGEMSDTQLQDSTVHHMYTLMAGVSSEQLRNQLPNLSTWGEKVELGMRHLRGRVQYSTQYARSYIEAAYGRIGQARLYNADHIKNNPLQSKIVLMRSKLQPEVINSFPRDFGLSKYSKQPVVVYDLGLGHADAPQDLRCTGIIDCHLDPNLHEIYAQKNQCDGYLPNGLKFLGLTHFET